MFSKNLRFYRLKEGVSKKELAQRSGLSPQAITNYEMAKRRPDIATIRKIAQVLNRSIVDFLYEWDQNLHFQHGSFRRNCSLPKSQQDFVRESVEEYFSRFFCIVEILGGEVLPPSPACHTLELSPSDEENAQSLRRNLRLSEEGPVANLIELLENKGILVYLHDGDRNFSGLSGTVNGRPYVVLNKNMHAERMRSTLVHELAHLMFVWPSDMPDKEQEQKATAISGAFLFPAADVKRELGLQRKGISKDMESVCQEYGISMLLLAKRACICGVISVSAERSFYIQASSWGWKKKEPERIEREDATLFRQLVFRAVSEDEISATKGAELLHMPISIIIQSCHFSSVE